MEYKPHEYQKYCEQFLMDHPACGLMIDLGLGKTVIVLSVLYLLILDYFELGRVLVIGPKRVIESSWPAEITKWDHLEGLTYSVVAGNEKQRTEALKKPAFLYLISRDNVAWLIEKGYWNFDGCVIDELSSFKAHNTKRFKALKKVRGKCKRIIGMTGTPGDLLSLWSQIYLLDGGERLERFITAYRERYFVPDKRNQTVIFSYRPKKGAEELIYQKISDICISMKAKEYLRMPELVVSNVEVKMSEEEQKKYDQLKADLILPMIDGDIDAQSAVGLTNKLQQMACGQVYDENGKPRFIHGRKMDALEDLIEAANGKPVLVIYSFKFDKEMLVDKFGAVPLDTSDDIERFNKGEIPVAVLHSAAGYGLNIQASCSHLIWYGLTWSVENYQQTNGRLYRQGQENTVTIQHIITKGTIDEDILAALEKKECTQEAILNAVKARVQ